jgi:hypothetical protein
MIKFIGRKTNKNYLLGQLPPHFFLFFLLDYPRTFLKGKISFIWGL